MTIPDPMNTPLAIAAYIQLLIGGADMSSSRMSKLVYLANGWNLVIQGQPLTPSLAIASNTGPSYRDIVSDASNRALRNGFGLSSTETAIMTESQRKVISHTLAKYAVLDDDRLRLCVAHEGSAWHQVYFGKGGRDAPIPSSHIEAEFRELARLSREATEGERTKKEAQADAMPVGRCFVTLGRGLEGHGEIEAVMELQRLTLKHGSIPYAKATGPAGGNTSFGIGKKDGVQLTISGTYDSIIRVEQLYDAERALVTAA
jgi:uncharacterized phage-associated protein